MTSRPNAGVVVLIAAVAVAVGAVGAALLVPHITAADNHSATGPSTVPIDTIEFDDARTVAVKPDIAESVPLVLASGGTVTASHCTPGATIASGSSPLTLDDRPVLALHTEVPLWRPVSLGDKGADVAALQRELVRLGHPLNADGEFGRHTRNAVNTIRKAVGLDDSGSLAPTDIVWLAQPEVRVESCGAAVGQVVSPGSPLATPQKQLLSVRLADAPGRNPPDGSRVLRIGDAQASVPTGGEVTDATLLAAFADSEQYQAWLASDGAAELNLTYALPQPITVALVPPAALFAVNGATACVSAQGASMPVEIVSSRLGQTLVTFANDAQPPKRVALDHSADATCR